MVYGLRDVAQAALIPHRFRSPALSARMRDAERMPASGSGDVSAGLRHGEFWALRDVTFAVRRGERFGVIGSNGAGKSTLFSVLSGIYGPSGGRVAVNGRLQALIALGAGFHPLLSGRENIYINAAILGMNTETINRKIGAIIEFADIGGFIDAPVKNYSSGMLVRLGFAIAAHLDPDILLIDEILAVGDARFQSRCIAFSNELAEQGRTVLLVTHALSTVLQVCQRAIWLDHGHIEMEGEASEVVRNYSAWSLQPERRGLLGAGEEGWVRTDVIEMSYRIEAQKGPDLPVGGTGQRRLPIVVRGSPLRLLIRYKLFGEITGGLNFWAHVKDAASNVRVFGTAGAILGSLVPAKKGQEGEVVIEWPDNPLLEGVYNWDLGVSDYAPGGSTGSLAKVLEREGSFVVVSSKADFQQPVTGSSERLPLVEWPSRLLVRE